MSKKTKIKVKFKFKLRKSFVYPEVNCCVSNMLSAEIKNKNKTKWQ